MLVCVQASPAGQYVFVIVCHMLLMLTCISIFAPISGAYFNPASAYTLPVLPLCTAHSTQPLNTFQSRLLLCSVVVLPSFGARATLPHSWVSIYIHLLACSHDQREKCQPAGLPAGAVVGAGLVKLALPSERQGELTLSHVPPDTNPGQVCLMEVHTSPCDDPLAKQTR
jgi:hypothetical protein